jgi:clan AA aspartic protease
MGTVNGRLTLRNPRSAAAGSLEVYALVDTGADYLCIPQTIAEQLALETAGTKHVALADGSVIEVPYVGPVQVHCKERTCFVGALVMGEQVLLGAIPLEDLDLIVHPLTRSLEPNPRPHGRGCL